MIANGSPPLGDNDPDAAGESYKSFSARWDDPAEGEVLKKLVSRFDGQGVVLNTGANEPKTDKGEQGGGEVEKMAKRATKLGK